MTNREKFREVFNKGIHWSRALEPQILALKSAHIDGIDCMEEWLNSEYIEPQAESEVKEMTFEVGKTYQHSTGKRMTIIGRLKTHTYGECLIGEYDNGELISVGESEENAVNWVEVRNQTKEDRLNRIISDIAYILDNLCLLRSIQKTGDCNICKNRDCGYMPKTGRMVRYNCPFYKSESEENNEV